MEGTEKLEKTEEKREGFTTSLLELELVIKEYEKKSNSTFVTQKCSGQFGKNLPGKISQL